MADIIALCFLLCEEHSSGEYGVDERVDALMLPDLEWLPARIVEKLPGTKNVQFDNDDDRKRLRSKPLYVVDFLSKSLARRQIASSTMLARYQTRSKHGDIQDL